MHCQYHGLAKHGTWMLSLRLRLQAWQSPEAAQQLSTAHMAYLCAALVQLTQSMDKADLDASQQLMSALVQGISTHLDSPLPALK